MKPTPRKPTQKEIDICSDLSIKAASDAVRVTDISTQLAFDTLGPTGAAVMAMRVAYSFLIGAAMILHAERTGEVRITQDDLSIDDELFVAMLCIATMAYGGANSITIARDWFLGATHRDIDIPASWQKPPDA